MENFDCGIVSYHVVNGNAYIQERNVARVWNLVIQPTMIGYLMKMF